MRPNGSRDDIIAARRERVAHWRLRGLSLRGIAGKLQDEGLVNTNGKPFTHVTIKFDLDALDKAWQERARGAIDDQKARELAKLDAVEAEAWAAWEASLMPRTVTISETVKERGDALDAEAQKGEGEQEAKEPPLITIRDKTRRTVEQSTGDPRYLDIIKDCGVKRAKLMGWEAPTKTQSANVDLTSLTVEQLERLAAGEDVLSVLGSTSPR